MTNSQLAGSFLLFIGAAFLVLCGVVIGQHQYNDLAVFAVVGLSGFIGGWLKMWRRT